MNTLLHLAGVCLAAAAATFVVLEIARHRHYLKHRDSGFVPSTQHWCMLASLIQGVFVLAAVVLMVLWAITRIA
jgi:hypothetical protein